MNTLARFALIIGLFIIKNSTHAQTVYAGETTIDKAKVSGLYLTLQGDGKQIEKDWEAQLQKFGRVTSSRGTYRVPSADISAISSEPINLASTVKTTRTSATIFAAFDLGSGNFVTPGGTGYSAAEALLKGFADNSLFGQEVKTAEGGFDEAQKNHQKMVKKGEQLQRAIEQNAKEKERLLKRIDDNAKELEQLNKDIETNKTDQATALTELESRKKNVEAVKAKKSN
ncbi:hypothetical protein GO730_06115 [Spirosoma sp. HMF3257]|uniref:Uncharacterized protein n=1 Tax=Spirosoma telluris TaxID=2183553 RepID=A0A327NFE4_9BACT|nr:hypothetical protein [Spirosoma telluris]RAI74040.1 hypothetical protein HMF3257_06065 [Spirosoma telluris]